MGTFGKTYGKNLVQISANTAWSRDQVDTYLIALAASGDTTPETIDIRNKKGYRTVASNAAMITLQTNNKTVLVKEKLGNERITNGTFDNSGAGWEISGTSTVNTGVGRILSIASAASYIRQSIGMFTGEMYKLIIDVAWISGTAQVGNAANYYSLNSNVNGAAKTRYLVSAEPIFYIKKTTSCDVSVDNVSVKQVVNNRFSVIGDSISTEPAYVSKVGFNRHYAILNHAVASKAIADHFATQVAASATDNADIIIFALGHNDNNAGDINALKVILRDGFDAIKITNPTARLYYMNVLPTWTDVIGATVLNKSNIRTAISDVCAEKGVVCWDTMTDPWIIASDTLDGTHPTDGGHTKIKDRILALLPL